MQRERVQDQYPWTWEIPLAIACGMLIVGVASCQLSRSVANWVAGCGWRWPTADKLVSSVPGLLAGDAAAGLPDIQNAANAAVLWGWLTCVGVLAATGLTVAGLWAWRRWGPGWMRGMATITEAHELLGVGRLWTVRRVVRPDLYPTGRRANR